MTLPWLEDIFIHETITRKNPNDLAANDASVEAPVTVPVLTRPNKVKSEIARNRFPKVLRHRIQAACYFAVRLQGSERNRPEIGNEELAACRI